MSVIERTIKLFAPHICMVCASEGNLVCNGCQINIAALLPSSCFMCNAATNDFLTCFSCRKKSAIKHVWTVGPYEGRLKELISRFKYDRQRAAVRVLAEMIDIRLPYFRNSPLVTYVPTATSRVRQRGYDHSRLLAQEIAKLRGWKMTRLLARHGQSRQVGSLRRKRIKQVVGAYRAINQTHINNRVILLVDDISTTGATVNEAAKALKTAGANEVNVALVARKV